MITLAEVASMLGSKVEPADRDEWESVIDAFAGRHVKAGSASSSYWRNKALVAEMNLAVLKTQLGAAS